MKMRPRVTGILAIVLASSSVFAQNKALVTPNPTPEAKALYQFLLDNYGKKIISGTMTLASMDTPNWLKQNTGKEPALIGIDWMQTNQGWDYDPVTNPGGWYKDKPEQDAITYYNRHGIPIMCWHWRDPLKNGGEFYWKGAATNYTTFDIKKISDPTSAEYKAMIKDIDYIAGRMKTIQSANVAILWRPLHEAAGGWFWWGQDGPSCKKLWQIMYDRMVNYNGLKNLIWVWTSEIDNAKEKDFYPGDAYVDIVGRDYYANGDHSSFVSEFNKVKSTYTKQLVTLSECGSFPDPDNLVKDKAGWSWFMTWYGDYVTNAANNSLDLWKKAFASNYVLTLDEMPDLRKYGQTAVMPKAQEAKAPGLSVSRIADGFSIRSDETVDRFFVTGIDGKNMSLPGGTTGYISANQLQPGVYVLRSEGPSGLRQTRFVVDR